MVVTGKGTRFLKVSRFYKSVTIVSQFFPALFLFGKRFFFLRQGLAISLCSPVWPRTHDLPASAPQVLGLLGLQVCATMLSSIFLIY
jgi:hypothetical protein